MRIFTRTIALLALPLALTAGGSGVLTASQQADITHSLEASRDALLGHMAALTDEQWSFKPAPDRWSPAEIVEHLYRSEGFAHQVVDGLMAEPANPKWRELTVEKTAMIRNVIPDRSQKAQAPDFLQPSGEMSRAELVSGFIKARAQTIKKVRAEAPYQEHVGLDSPLGPMNAAQWLEFPALHTERHTKQLAEVLADPGFPK